MSCQGFRRRGRCTSTTEVCLATSRLPKEKAFINMSLKLLVLNSKLSIHFNDWRRAVGGKGHTICSSTILLCLLWICLYLQLEKKQTEVQEPPFQWTKIIGQAKCDGNTVSTVFLCIFNPLTAEFKCFKFLLIADVHYMEVHFLAKNLNLTAPDQIWFDLWLVAICVQESDHSAFCLFCKAYATIYAIQLQHSNFKTCGRWNSSSPGKLSIQFTIWRAP